MANEDIDISIPSYRPADSQSESGTMEFLFQKFAQKLEKVTPAKIISYNDETNRADVQILTQNITSTGSKLSKSPLSDIPVFRYGGGGFIQKFPIKEDDIGILIASDRNISVFKRLLNIFAPADYECHQYKDSIFFPLIINGFSVSEDDKGAVVLSSIDGATKFSLSNGKITMNAVEILLNGKTRVEGEFSAQKVSADDGATGKFANSVDATNGIVTGGS